MSTLESPSFSPAESTPEGEGIGLRLTNIVDDLLAKEGITTAEGNTPLEVGNIGFSSGSKRTVELSGEPMSQQDMEALAGMVAAGESEDVSRQPQLTGENPNKDELEALANMVAAGEPEQAGDRSTLIGESPSKDDIEVITNQVVQRSARPARHLHK